MPAPLPPPIEPEPPRGSFLFPDEIIQELTDEERKHGKYTLARLPKVKEECIVQLLIERRPHRDIERMIQVHNETIRLVADKHAEEIDAQQKHFGKKLRRVNWALADRLEKNAESFPLQSIPLAIKLIGEHAELIEGRATERIEEVHRVDIFEHWKQFKAGHTIGLSGEKMPVMDAELVAGAEDQARLQDGDREATTDSESDVCQASTQGNGQPINVLFDDQAPRARVKNDLMGQAPAPTGGGACAVQRTSGLSIGEPSDKIFENGGS